MTNIQDAEDMAISLVVIIEGFLISKDVIHDSLNNIDICKANICEVHQKEGHKIYD